MKNAGGLFRFCSPHGAAMFPPTKRLIFATSGIPVVSHLRCAVAGIWSILLLSGYPRENRPTINPGPRRISSGFGALYDRLDAMTPCARMPLLQDEHRASLGTF